jgi:hypothetical protein
MSSEAFKRKQHERLWKIEGLFSEAKKCHCPGRAKYRTLTREQIQVCMCAIAQNIKRLSLRAA